MVCGQRGNMCVVCVGCVCTEGRRHAEQQRERERGRAQGRADVSCVCDLIEMGRSSGVEGREGGRGLGAVGVWWRGFDNLSVVDHQRGRGHAPSSPSLSFRSPHSVVAPASSSRCIRSGPGATVAAAAAAAASAAAPSAATAAASARSSLLPGGGGLARRAS